MANNRNRTLALVALLAGAALIGMIIGDLAGAREEEAPVMLAQEGGHGSHHDEPAPARAGGHEDRHDAENEAAETHGGEHAGGAHEEEEGAPELPNLVTILRAYLPDFAWVRLLHRFENALFAWLAAGILCVTVHTVFRRRSIDRPGKLQALIEVAVEGLNNLVSGILGEEGRRYVPFLGSLFLYILMMNLMGLVPFLKSPTSSLDITAGLAICVFLYVQYTGIRNFGILGYLDHLAGNPRDPITWALVPIMIPLHVIGELAKPLSLSLRLFGNITGEDILLAVFVGLGAASLHFTGLPVGIPFQVPLIFLAILTSVIQALVFTLLSTVYFLLMQHHEEEAH